MFEIEANPTIDADLTLVGQGREQVLSLTFKHMLRDEYLKLIEDVRDGKVKPEKALADLIVKWNAKEEPKEAAIKKLDLHQPGALMAILGAYGDSLVVSRKGN